MLLVATKKQELMKNKVQSLLTEIKWRVSPADCSFRKEILNLKMDLSFKSFSFLP